MEHQSESDNIYTEHFNVRTYETGFNNAVTLPGYCNYLQESAAKHAHLLEQASGTADHVGFTWSLSRLHLVVEKYVPWRDAVSVLTWPSGIRDRTTALRDFVIEDKWNTPLLQCVSEWIYLDVTRMEVAALPGYYTRLPAASAPRAEVPDTHGAIPDFSSPAWQSSITVRHTDHDFKNHVNNSHYVEWLFEALPPEWRNRRSVTELDINFKTSARRGDILLSEVIPEIENGLLHKITRESDGSVLITARTHWKGE